MQNLSLKYCTCGHELMLHFGEGKKCSYCECKQYTPATDRDEEPKKNG